MSLRVRRLIAARVQNCTAFRLWKQYEAVPSDPGPSRDAMAHYVRNVPGPPPDAGHQVSRLGDSTRGMAETRWRSVRGRSAGGFRTGNPEEIMRRRGSIC